MEPTAAERAILETLLWWMVKNDATKLQRFFLTQGLKLPYSQAAKVQAMLEIAEEEGYEAFARRIKDYQPTTANRRYGALMLQRQLAQIAQAQA